MPKAYTVKVKFSKLVKKWKKLTKTGFFMTLAPLKIRKDTIITLIFFSKKQLNKAKEILG